MKQSTRDVLNYFADGKVHDSRSVVEYMYLHHEAHDRTLVFNAMTRLASKWGYLERVAHVKTGQGCHAVMSYRITPLGLKALESPIVEYRGRGVGKRKGIIGRLITFDPESRDGEYFPYKPQGGLNHSPKGYGYSSLEIV